MNLPETDIYNFSGWLDGSGHPARGFDYELQVFVIDGKIVQCGHVTPDPTCNSCLFVGQPPLDVRERIRHDQ